MDAQPDAEPDAEPDDELDVGSAGEASAAQARTVEAGRFAASKGVDGSQRPAATAAAGRGAPPQQPTRRYSEVSDDDRDIGWGERPAPSGRDDDWYLTERPPHHG